MDIAYFGYLPNTDNVIGGGEVKTRSVLKALRMFGNVDKIQEYDTSDWKKHKLCLLTKLLYNAIKGNIIVFVSATNSFQRLIPILKVIHKVNEVEVHFIPVGNCMPQNFDTEKKKKEIGFVKGIYCQTETMKAALDDIGLSNTFVMHNFKFVESYCQHYTAKSPLRFVYFSRISEEKGIFECIDAIKKANVISQTCTLDIYGKIDPEIEEKFMRAIADSSDIKYEGNAAPDKSSYIIKDYYMVIFPTKYEGEGFPGVVIDSLAAGVPILTSRFGGFSDILKDGVDSLSFEFQNYDEMRDKLLFAIQNPEFVNKMRKMAHDNYKRYTPENEIRVLLSNIASGR